MTRAAATPDAMTMLGQLAMLSPGVVAQRLAMTWPRADLRPTARQRQELDRMVGEKLQAFGEGWWQLNNRMLQAWQAAWWQSTTAPFSPVAWPSAVTLLGVALQPSHRILLANARRLGRA